MFSRSCPRAFALVFLPGLLVLSIGCGSSDERANVKGKVTFAGKPLTAGTVMFYGEDNRTGSTSIDTEGNYEITDAPLGEVQITVTVPKLPPGGMRTMMPGPRMKKDQKDSGSVNPEDPSQRIAIMGKMPKKVVPIPDKFSTTDKSGLKYTVKKGNQTFDITLTP